MKRYFTKWPTFRVIWVMCVFVFCYMIYTGFWLWASETTTIHDILTIPAFCAFFQTLMMDIIFYKADAYGD